MMTTPEPATDVTWTFNTASGALARGPAAQYQTHPAWATMLDHYRAARTAWATYPAVRRTAAGFGMDERSYADHYVTTRTRHPTLITAKTPPHLLTWTRAHADRAYVAAGSA